MIKLDVEAIRDALGEAALGRLAEFRGFSEIDSTNSFLMQSPNPAPGQIHVALTDNQTGGRGRHGRTWQSPPGSGICLSMSYTFASQPALLPSLTLALGVGVIDTLESLGVSGVQLKWPNDLVAGDGKLGGILTETQAQAAGALTVVVGLGLNIDFGRHDPAIETDWASGVSDLVGIAPQLPARTDLAARLIDGLCESCVLFEQHGFGRFAHKWPQRDWLFGRAVCIDTPQRQVTGIGAGIAEDGALLIETGRGEYARVTSGSVVSAGARRSGE